MALYGGDQISTSFKTGWPEPGRRTNQVRPFESIADDHQPVITLSISYFFIALFTDLCTKSMQADEKYPTDTGKMFPLNGRLVARQLAD